MTDRELTFFNTEDFGAMAEAEAFLEEAGFSVGYPQAHSPRGVLFGEIAIQKWRNLSPADRDALHGGLLGGRTAPAIIQIFDTAPDEAKAAFDRAVKALRIKTGHAA